MTRAGQQDTIEIMTSTDRWILKIVGTVTAVGITAGIALLFSMRTDIAVMSVNVSSLSKRMDDAMLDRYTAQQAQIDKRDLINMIDDIKRDVVRNTADIESLRGGAE